MMNQKTLFALIAAPLALLAFPAHAALRVFACEPEWGALAQELGGSLVEVSVATSAYQPRKNTLMLDFNPSEFSRFRLQLAQDRSRQGLKDNQIFLQYQMSLGAHGAHGY